MVKTKFPCCDHTKLKQGFWTREEDDVLFNFVTQNGHGKWRSLPKRAGLRRCGKSCRLRWLNYLRPAIKRGNFTEEEDEAIIRLHGELGNKWAEIAAKLPDRTDNEIKNVWYHRLRKKALERNLNMQSFMIQNVGPFGGGPVVEELPYVFPAVHSDGEIWSAIAATTTSSVNGLAVEEKPNLEVHSSSETSAEASTTSSGNDSGCEDDYDLGESYWMQCLWPEI